MVEERKEDSSLSTTEGLLILELTVEVLFLVLVLVAE